MNSNTDKKPGWLKIKLPMGSNYSMVKKIISTNNLNTICTSGKCPNIGECWAAGTATIMILGEICTRNCRFCATNTGRPLPPDPEEPKKVAESIRLLGLKHAVITSVDRDDLTDKGAQHWAETIYEIKKVNPNTTIEVLIPDFDADFNLIQKIIDSEPEIISHNLETVRRITPIVRNKDIYNSSLQVIRQISASEITSKSGIMVGLGETFDEVIEVMDDLLNVGCHIFTIGQYLQPSKNHYPVKEYVSPGIFEKYKTIGLEKGFRFVESAPLVRSSYHAEKHI